MQGDLSSDASTVPAPDWSAIPREILCPLCGYNLRGLIEPRCPECGHRSTWEVLLAEEVVHPYLFEHHPERKARSWRRTLWASARRPGRFWRELLPVHRIRPVRLGVYWISIVVAGALAMLTLIPLTALDIIAQQNRRRESYLTYFEKNPQSVPPTLMRRFTSTQAYVDANFPVPTFRAVMVEQLQSWHEVWQPVRLSFLFTLVWPVATFASLLIFRASMLQARIRTGHVLRCVIYSVDPILLPVMATALFAVNWVRGGVWAPIPILHVHPIFAVLAIALLVIIYRLGMAYRRYLAFPHALATVAASQIIVLLGLWKISLVLSGY